MLREFFLLLELKDRVQATAEKYQKKLIRRFNTAKEEGKLRGGTPRVVQMDIDKEQFGDAAKVIVDWFAESDPSRNNKYLDWIVRQWIKGHLLWEDSFKMKALIQDFETYRKKLEKKDINHYESYRDLEQALEPLRGTEVAGVRVQNFLKKQQTQDFRQDMVANPQAEEHKEALQAMYGDEDEIEMPDWWEDHMREAASEHSWMAAESQDFHEEAERWIEKEDFASENDEGDMYDDDGELLDFDEEAWQEAVDEKANELEREWLEQYEDQYVSEHSEDEWREYVRNKGSEWERDLENTRDKKPALEVVYENDRMSVIVPNSKEASCYIGKGTQWCTAADESDNYWFEYSQDGPLYVLLTDKLPKQQWHFESDQFMDEHDRYIEDTAALRSIVRGYGNEIHEAFAGMAQETEAWWVAPASEMDEDAWNVALDRSRSSNEGDVRKAVRIYQAHGDKNPEWASEVKKNIMGGKYAQQAVKEGWVGKLEDEEIDEAIMKGIENNTIDAVKTAEYVATNNKKIQDDTWYALAKKGADTAWYMPLELITPEFTRQHLAADEAPGRQAFGASSRFKRFFDNMQTLRGQEHDKERHPWAGEALKRGRAMATHITMRDIVNDVIANPDNLKEYKAMFGIKPWLEVAKKALNDPGLAKELAHTIDHALGRMEGDEDVQEQLVRLYWNLLKHVPQILGDIYRVSEQLKGTFPLEVQNAVVQHVADIEDERERYRQAMSITRYHEDELDERHREAMIALADGRDSRDVMRALPAQSELPFPAEQLPPVETLPQEIQQILAVPDELRRRPMILDLARSDLAKTDNNFAQAAGLLLRGKDASNDKMILPELQRIFRGYTE